MPRHRNTGSFKYNPEAHVQLTCESCNRNFTRLRGDIRKATARGTRIRFCSRKCFCIGWRGSKNPAWAGDYVGYRGVHRWVKMFLMKPKLCQMCKQKPPRDLVNVTGVYDRDLINWAYFCASCHSLYDGDITNLPRR